MIAFTKAHPRIVNGRQVRPWSNNVRSRAALDVPGIPLMRTNLLELTRGLSENEARARLAAEGYNELPRSDRRTPFKIVLEVLREPMLALLLVGGAVYLALGDLNEALVLLAFATLSIAITVVQETRTERVLEALRELTSPRALVIRGGERKRIAGREVVRGDIVVLAEGDRVPADSVLIDANDLQADESLLTGESVPVRKVALEAGRDRKFHRAGGDDLPEIFSGSLIVRGTGIAEVYATGAKSEIGKIGQSLKSVETATPQLQAQIGQLVRVFAMLGGAVSLIAVLLYGILRGGWLEAVLAGIALGMSMLPEEFPVVLTVFMAMGAWRISRARVLTRRASAIEALGSATVLCTDKTGTLTENRMSLADFRSLDGSVLALQDIRGEMNDRWRELLTFGILASAQTAFDPMEKAFHELGQRELAKETLTKIFGYELAHSYGLRPAFLAMTQIWRPEENGSGYVVAAKGAPEAIAKLCRLGETERAALTAAQEAMAGNGLRILAIARGTFSGENFPATQQEIPFEFLGLAGLADPLRSSVTNAVRDCRSAGIKVIMITGDYKATARAIALQAGIAADDVLSGEDLARMTEHELAQRVRTATVFARVMPEQKLGIVTALKRNNQIVAMTGDGVNDAPSLKAAHIGIAMGGRGTDVAREASSIVLLDDDFGSIVGAIRLGRRIYDNLRKAMGFIFAVHVPIAGLALLPLIFGLPIILGPMHIAFLEMVIDPVCSLVFEAETEEPNVMRRPPRGPDEPLFSRALIVWSLVQGAFALGLVALIFVIAWQRGAPEAEVRALTFFSLAFAIVGLIFVNRSFSSSLRTAVARPNATLGWVLLAVVGGLGATLSWPFARELFRFGPLHLHDILLAVTAGGRVLVILELLKSLWRKSSGGQSGLWRPV